MTAGNLEDLEWISWKVDFRKPNYSTFIYKIVLISCHYFMNTSSICVVLLIWLGERGLRKVAGKGCQRTAGPNLLINPWASLTWITLLNCLFLNDMHFLNWPHFLSILLPFHELGMIGFYIDWICSPTGYDWKIHPKSFQWGVDMIIRFRTRNLYLEILYTVAILCFR